MLKKFLLIIMCAYLLSCAFITSVKWQAESEYAARRAAEERAIKTDRVLPDTIEPGAFLAGVLAKEKNDWEKATSYFQKALTQDSGNDDLRIQTYLLSLILGNFTVADTLSESLNLNKESDWFVRQVHRADLFAARKYEAIVSSDFDPQNTADALLTAFFKSWTFVALGKEKEALNTLESIKKDQVLSPLYWYQKGLIHLYFKQETLADSAFQQLKVSGVPNASAWHAVRRFYETRGRWGKENPLYQDYMAFFTQKPALNQLLTELMPAQLDTPDKALSEAIYSVSTLVGEEDGFAALALNAAALRLNPDYDLIKILSAEILDNMGNYKQAAQYYNRIGKLSGLNFLKKGLSFQKAGMHDKALPVFQKLISENPKNALLYRLAAESFVALNQLDLALNYYSYAILNSLYETNKNELADMYAARAMLYDKLEESDLAEKDFLRALSLAPENPILLNNIGYRLLEQDRDIQSAFSLIVKARKKAPQDPYILDSHAYAFYKIKKYDQALPLAERAADRLPQSGLVMMHLGDIYQALGRHREAVFQYKKALDLDTDLTAAQKSRMRDFLTISAEKKALCDE